MGGRMAGFALVVVGAVAQECSMRVHRHGLACLRTEA